MANVKKNGELVKVNDSSIILKGKGFDSLLLQVSEDFDLSTFKPTNKVEVEYQVVEDMNELISMNLKEEINVKLADITKKWIPADDTSKAMLTKGIELLNVAMVKAGKAKDWETAGNLGDLLTLAEATLLTKGDVWEALPTPKTVKDIPAGTYQVDDGGKWYQAVAKEGQKIITMARSSKAA